MGNQIGPAFLFGANIDSWCLGYHFEIMINGPLSALRAARGYSWVDLLTKCWDDLIAFLIGGRGLI